MIEWNITTKLDLSTPGLRGFILGAWATQGIARAGDCHGASQGPGLAVWPSQKTSQHRGAELERVGFSRTGP